jgi:uncharacterized OB-fold protein
MSDLLSGTARRNPRSAPWFDALADGVLLIHRCRRCDHHSRPDAVGCPACQADDLEWVPAAGSGTVVCVILDRSGRDVIALGLVELDEGPWLHARLTDVTQVEAGARVALTVLSPTDGDGESIPSFTPSN